MGDKVKYKDAACNHCGESCEVVTCRIMGDVSECHGVGFDYIDEDNRTQSVNEDNRTQSVNEDLRYVPEWNDKT